ncbi:hypothetical protein SynA15127_01784 [Synechococcus sp. A15-127]|uniref:hypothetical protein n=1 Tax=Synechococcus sp. A15-127 TaxID=1050624 RepID=UPI001646D728|nr:hypothetical protein [Synechococcus sp. A15-127]QNI94860.1 hypothetical protein SynA15127_01784 [Synechococcus sp. A15-127]
MPFDSSPSAADLALHLEQRGDLSKPWYLQMLRMQKLKETKGEMDPQDYIERIQEAHGDLMRLGQVWKGREAELFDGTDPPPDVMEPRPGSADDR